MLFFNIVQRIVQVWEMLIQKPQYKYLCQYFLSLDNADILYFYIFKFAIFVSQYFSTRTRIRTCYSKDCHSTLYHISTITKCHCNLNCCINYSVASVV